MNAYGNTKKGSHFRKRQWISCWTKHQVRIMPFHIKHKVRSSSLPMSRHCFTTTSVIAALRKRVDSLRAEAAEKAQVRQHGAGAHRR